MPCPPVYFCCTLICLKYLSRPMQRSLTPCCSHIAPLKPPPRVSPDHIYCLTDMPMTEKIGNTAVQHPIQRTHITIFAYQVLCRPIGFYTGVLLTGKCGRRAIKHTCSQEWWPEQG